MMIGLNMRQLVYVAISTFNNANGRSSIVTWQRALHGYPDIATSRNNNKREYLRHTKYDYAFSEWKTLITPCDWEDKAINTKGSKRYRIENLPNLSRCPMIYELAAAISLPRRSHDFLVTVLYVGRSYNIRKRLQSYGRDGAHLRINSQPPIFRDILSRGISVAYRVAPMKSKKEAEETERELLREFDYPLNHISNGLRRPQDLHSILNYLDDVRFAEIENGDPAADLDSKL